MLRMVSALAMVFGTAATLCGVVALACASVAPAQPGPNMNEGPGLAALVGFLATAIGVAALAVGFLIRAGIHTRQK